MVTSLLGYKVNVLIPAEPQRSQLSRYIGLVPRSSGSGAVWVLYFACFICLLISIVQCGHAIRENHKYIICAMELRASE